MTSGQCYNILGSVTGLLQASVAHRWINLYPMDSAIGFFPNTYPLDGDLSPGGGGVLPYMGHIGTCRGIGYGF